MARWDERNRLLYHERRRFKVVRDGVGWSVLCDGKPIEFTWTRGLATQLRKNHILDSVQLRLKESKGG